ncbi:MAG: aldehyde ferredoxin oxidoreductase N-terminal domain-containing protein, partial [Syntrophomonadaceae bacterium]|nr:aldehyde ferredoxin oxidoreductase N-terminal domain-containing protein [Syntrophomonadaceae bacterium]
MNGWMGKILRVNLSQGTVDTEALNMAYAQQYIGARGLGTKYFMEEVDPKVDPLSSEDKIVFMTGPVTGTFASSGGRYDV